MSSDEPSPPGLASSCYNRDRKPIERLRSECVEFDQKDFATMVHFILSLANVCAGLRFLKLRIWSAVGGIGARRVSEGEVAITYFDARYGDESIRVASSLTLFEVAHFRLPSSFSPAETIGTRSVSEETRALVRPHISGQNKRLPLPSSLTRRVSMRSSPQQTNCATSKLTLRVPMVLEGEDDDSTKKNQLRNLRCWVPIFVLILAHISVNRLSAQQIQVEAASGVPFGVGQVTVLLDRPLDVETIDTARFTIEEKNGRVHYPAVRLVQPLEVLREILGAPMPEDPDRLQIHFLFTGSEPLDLTIRIPSIHTVHVVPNGRPLLHLRLLRAWWLRFKSAARKQKQEGDYTPLVETYLTHMLSHRLGLPIVDLQEDIDTTESMAMMLGTEKLRLQTLVQSLSGAVSRQEVPHLELPSPIDWEAFALPQLNAPTEVEPIAQHVPEECFYIRFAQFPNYLWLRRLLEEYGGDLSRMVTLRGTDPLLNRRVEDQLGLKENALARVLGPQVISDVALIGRDTFLREGAAIGILFEAKNDLLRTDLQRQRQQAVDAWKSDGATMRNVTLEGKEVSLASTPDHRLRSFYAQDGEYHLVTNCEQIARRFLQCGRGTGGLGKTAEFQHARTILPIEEDNTIFVYLSTRFFEGLLSPQYQIELMRRLMSVTDVELIQLAQWTASAEGLTNPNMEQLVRQGLLGAPIDRRPDASQSIQKNERWLDSQRGARGTYLPIPDVIIDKVTASEVDRFQRIADFYRRRWKQLDPVLVGLRRTALNEQVERVQIDARMFPLNAEKFGMISGIFGQPTDIRVQQPSDDIVAMQAVLNGGALGIPPHHLFFGIRDAAPEKVFSNRPFLKSLQILRNTPAYLGAWPKPGYLDRFGLLGRPDGTGFQRLLFGLYRLETPDAFSLISFDRNVLADVANQLTTAASDDLAQVRIHIGDIQNSRFGTWANSLDFQRAWETSVGNVHLMHVMNQQFKIPIAEARRRAEQLLDARFHCPLSGEYELVEDPHGSRWASTAWTPGKQKAQESYTSPLMSWLRGFEASLTVADQRVVATGVLDIQRAEVPEKGSIKLPFFDLLRGNQGTKEDK